MQFFLNLLSNKRNFFDKIDDWESKNLFFTIDNILSDHCLIFHLKPVCIRSLSASHQKCLLRDFILMYPAVV